MSTRCTLVIKNEDGTVILRLYRHFDGYFHGMGKEIVEFIRHGKLVDGYRDDAKFGEVFETMGDLAVQLMSHFKRPKKNSRGEPVCRVGNYYVVAENHWLEEVNYELGCRKEDGEWKIYLTGEGLHEDTTQKDGWNSGKVELFPLTLENTRYTKTTLIPLPKRGRKKKA